MRAQHRLTNVVNKAKVDAIEIIPNSVVAPVDVRYGYRGDGLRYSKTVSGQQPISYTWDLNAALPVVVQDGSCSYVYGLGLVSQTDGSGSQSYLLGNGLGSTEELTDGAGNPIASYKYDVFGALRSSTCTGSTEYRFTGQQEDAALGYTYLRARYYDPATGRFLSKDPWPGRLDRPVGLTPYIYLASNPVMFIDSTMRIIYNLLQEPRGDTCGNERQVPPRGAYLAALV